MYIYSFRLLYSWIFFRTFNGIRCDYESCVVSIVDGYLVSNAFLNRLRCQIKSLIDCQLSNVFTKVTVYLREERTYIILKMHQVFYG